MNRSALLLVLALGACEGAFDTADGRVEDGNAALTAGKVDEAKARYDEAARVLPESPSLNYVRGLAASLGGDHASAADLLLRALETKDERLEQRVKAALGVAYAREALSLERMPAAPDAADPNAPAPEPDAPDAASKGAPKVPEAAMEKWKLAVTFLEDALALDPRDAEARRNLEVALLRVDPPCATRDDSFEDNDARDAAKLLEVAVEQPNASEAAPQAPNQDVLRFRQQLFSCPDDEDWYRLELGEGDRVELGATAPKETGRIRVELLRPDGSRHAEVATTGDKIRFTVKPGEAGAWLVHQVNLDFDEVSYGLEVVVRPPCGKNEDAHEDNDSPLQAKTVTPGPLPDLKACPGDEDWFSLVLAEGESLFLYAQPADAPADESEDKAAKDEPPVPGLEVEVTDETGAVRATGAPAGKARISTLLTPGPGRYLVRVRSAPSGFGPARDEPFEGRYSLQFEVVPPCPEGDDRFEDNDRVEDATDFMQAAAPPEQAGGNPMQPQQQGPPVVFARVCPGEADWWTFTSDGQKPEIVSLTFDHAQGDLDMTLWDEVGTTELASSKTSSAAQNAEALPLPMAEKPAPDPNAPPKPSAPPDPNAPPEPPPAPKTYRLEVRGASAEAQNFYLLRLDQPSGGGDGQQDDQDKQDQQDQQDQKDQKDQKDPQDKQDQKDQAEQNPLQDALDKLDKNPENLPARDAAKKSPLANQKPLKDW